MPEDITSSEQEESRRYGQLQIARMQMAQQQEEEQSPSSQEREGMSFSFFLFLLIPSIIADGIDIISGGTIGWIIGIIVDLFLLIALGVSRNKKKTQVYKILAGFGLETVLPILDMLPFRTIFVVWAYISENPKAQKAAGTAATVIDMTQHFSGVKKDENSDTLKKAA